MVGELCAEWTVEGLAFVQTDGTTAGATVVIGELYAVDVGFVEGWVRAEGFGDFGCAYIFALWRRG